VTATDFRRSSSLDVGDASSGMVRSYHRTVFVQRACGHDAEPSRMSITPL
jgi:hypothetical protein